MITSRLVAVSGLGATRSPPFGSCATPRGRARCQRRTSAPDTVIPSAAEEASPTRINATFAVISGTWERYPHRRRDLLENTHRFRAERRLVIMETGNIRRPPENSRIRTARRRAAPSPGPPAEAGPPVVESSPSTGNCMRSGKDHAIVGRHAINVVTSLLDRPWDMPSFSAGFHETGLAPVVVRWTRPTVLLSEVGAN